MNKQTFEKHIANLEKALKPLASKKEERDEKLEVYYERLKDVDEYLFSKAVKLLQDNYEYRNFPLIADILKAIHGVKESMRKEYHLGEACDICQGTGWIITDCVDELGKHMQYNHASPCRYCGTGQAVKKACNIHDAKIGRQRHGKKLKKTIRLLAENLPNVDEAKGKQIELLDL